MVPVAESSRKWPCFDKSRASKPCVCCVGMQEIWEKRWRGRGGRDLGRGCTCRMDYVYYPQRTFIPFYVSFICISRFLCAAALLLIWVLTDCGVESNLTRTIILSRVTHGMRCNVQTPAVQKMVLSLFCFDLRSASVSSPCSEVKSEDLFLKKN